MTFRIAPHLFALATSFVILTVASVWFLPKLTSDTLVSEADIMDNSTFRFHATGDAPLRFFVLHTFSGITGPGTNATLELADETGNVIYRANASIGPVPKGKKDEGHPLFATIPDHRPPRGELVARYVYESGTRSSVSLTITEGGWIIREGGEQTLFFVLAPAALIGFGAVFGVRPADREAVGRARLAPEGASRTTMIAAALAGVAASVALIGFIGETGLPFT